MADWLRSHGHQVSVIDIVSHQTEEDARILKEHYDKVEVILRRQGIGGYFGCIIPVRKAVKKLNPQVVHGHYLSGASFFARWSGHPIIVNSGWGSDLYQDCKKWQLRMLVKSAIRGSDVVTGDSDHILNEVRKYSPKVRTYKFLFGVDTSLFVPKPELKSKEFTFLSGRSSYELYNPIRIIHAFELLDGIDSRLLLQRSRFPYPELEKVVNESPAKDRIEWCPSRDHSKMPELFNKAHVTISIPNSDSSSSVMMESMACGVPVIASKIPQNDEWDGLGIYVPKDDSVEALAELMKKVMEQPELVRAYGKFAREVIIQRADWDKQMEGLVKLYEELME
jgi:glycosyltransferase involved in cell wall biosynthesis